MVILSSKHFFRVFLSIFSLLISCKNNLGNTEQRKEALFRKDNKIVLKEIKEMSFLDQSIRNMALFGTGDTLIIDSIYNYYEARGFNLDSILLLNDTFLTSAAFRDSIQILREEQDKKHTARMIFLINKYGYPESDRIDSSIKISPFLILHHPSSKYKDTMLTLLNHELKVGRIDTISFEMIKWDYNGRNGLPNIPGMKVQKNKDGTTTIQF